MISLWSLTVASTEWLLESAIRDQLPDVVDRHTAWQKALDRVRLFEARWSRHQAILSLEGYKVTCKQLRHIHLHRYLVATLKAPLVMICQYKVARAKASIAMGINAAIHRICAERDLCATPLDAILAKIKHCEIVHNNSSRTMSPACLPQSSAQVMMPPSPTTMTPSSPPSHTHPTSYLGAVLSPKGGDCKPSLQVLQATTAHKSAAVMLHWTTCQHKQPRCHPGRRNVPWAPNPPDEAIPSHPQPTMGRTSMPALSDLTSARVNNRAPCSHLSPSLQPFTIEGGD